MSLTEWFWSNPRSRAIDTIGSLAARYRALAANLEGHAAVCRLLAIYTKFVCSNRSVDMEYFNAVFGEALLVMKTVLSTDTNDYRELESDFNSTRPRVRVTRPSRQNTTGPAVVVRLPTQR